MLFNKTASFQIKELTVTIMQLSTKKKVKIDIYNLQSLLNEGNKVYSCLNSKDNIYYNYKNAHLRGDKNIINTYLTKGFDKKLYAHLETHIKAHEDQIDRLYEQWLESQEKGRIIGGYHAS